MEQCEDPASRGPSLALLPTMWPSPRGRNSLVGEARKRTFNKTPCLTLFPQRWLVASSSPVGWGCYGVSEGLSLPKTSPCDQMSVGSKFHH